MNNDPAACEKLNRFRHLLYEMQASDRDVCKLIDMNMRKNMAKIKEEIDKEKDGKQRRNTIGGIKKTGEKKIQPKAIKK